MTGPLPSRLLLNSVAAGVTTLGPGPCVVIWTQGCSIGCGECTSPDTWDRGRGLWASIADVAAWATATGLERLTLSGGEPAEQAGPLVELLDSLRRSRPWMVTCYSGRYRQALEASGDPAVDGLLGRLDLLIDGPYVAGLHAPVAWRGSTNQTLHRLSDRIDLPVDRHAGLSLEVNDDGSFAFLGVPPVRGFRNSFERERPGGLAAAEVRPDPRSFPFPVQLPSQEV